MSDQDLRDHGRRIAELERKIADLYERLGQAEPEFGMTFASDAAPGPADDPRFAQLLDEGNLIGAIKLYRELTGVGLKEAKDAVEAMDRGKLS